MHRDHDTLSIGATVNDIHQETLFAELQSYSAEEFLAQVSF